MPKLIWSKTQKSTSALKKPIIEKLNSTIQVWNKTHPLKSNQSFLDSGTERSTAFGKRQDPSTTFEAPILFDEIIKAVKPILFI